MQPDDFGIEKWLHYAKNDLLVAKELQLQKEFVYRAVLTHAQQSVEKYLKAFVLLWNLKFIRTHDLILLNRICAQVKKDFSSFDERLAWLSSVYIESRYPDDFEDIDRDDAEKALIIASDFEKFILGEFEK